MFVKVRQAFTVGAILFLLMLFLLPSLYLKSECEALNQLCDQVVSSRDGAAYDELKDRYEAMRGKAELFERIAARLLLALPQKDGGGQGGAA